MKEKCQVFTPAQTVVELLNSVGYVSNLYGKKVMENACGDGNILSIIVKRYIEDSLNKGLNKVDIKLGLERDIHGAEIDKEHYKKCISNLNTITEGYEIRNVNWRIVNKDILKEKIEPIFDFVIGNPPYITYRDLNIKTRKYLKSNYDSCIYGKFDYCYAFIELSIKSLNNNGKLGYLIPSSIFKNVFAQKLRDSILPFTTEIIDYTTKKIFKKVTVSSAILICEKSNIQNSIQYYDVVSDKKIEISKEKLIGKWIFSNWNTKNTDKERFGDYFTAAISVATLKNDVFVLKKYSSDEQFIIVERGKIEKSIVREGVSPKSLKYNKNELIIFPYKYEEDKLIRYSKEKFEETFAEATKYLNTYLDKLNKRDSDKSVQWFEYGRTQALAHLNQDKLLVSTILTAEVKVYELSKYTIPYSGIYIVSKGRLPLSKAKEILESEEFYQYAQNVGINANGSSKRITATDINNFEF
ncbi:Eco57I restriction-modification methylase domain-containing protein [Metasolibacillus meyeri]|uniref:site-specific DNA-methyltransferase (adenine-specific) n=1 Tax=Metasolibacillus meyeri TaxID=1071052 RepID=A0AAW9NR46_9BACL|nr:Eco57I restriction-modification methylase domain-containing protein [Metasolibacillus meyeri]MEC1177318.1 Eco57I restriction-modification methylase domain-containing protein [Metasolibacillus meyeri]